MVEGQNLGDDIKDENGKNYTFQGGRAMANVQSGEEIVISGIFRVLIDTVLPFDLWYIKPLILS